MSNALKDLESSSEDVDITVVDFCSGSGGPTPIIEQTVNQARLRANKDPVHFLMSDLFPPVDDWIPLAEQSASLSFIPQPVDAVDPPSAAMSDAYNQQSPSTRSHRAKVLRLYCLSFHHFDDQAAMEILANTMATADAFVIIELTERRLSSLILMFFQSFVTFLVQPLWFWRRPFNLLYTYPVPALPFLMLFDGLVSALRSRTLDELLDLVTASNASKFDANTVLSSRMQNRTTRFGQMSPITIKDWTCRGGRIMHTFPFGYMTWFVGTRA